LVVNVFLDLDPGRYGWGWTERSQRVNQVQLHTTHNHRRHFLSIHRLFLHTLTTSGSRVAQLSKALHLSARGVPRFKSRLYHIRLWFGVP
jgi:hypothetical protein